MFNAFLTLFAKFKNIFSAADEKSTREKSIDEPCAFPIRAKIQRKTFNQHSQAEDKGKCNTKRLVGYFPFGKAEATPLSRSISLILQHEISR